MAYKNNAYTSSTGDVTRSQSDVRLEVTSFKKNYRTTLEKVLIGLCVILFVALVTVAVLFALESTASSDSKQEVCLTPECVSAAARISRYLDASVNPCDDMYQFSCGRWMQENVIPDDKASLTSFSILRESVEVVVKNLLERPDSDDDLRSEKMVKNLYKSCMNTDLIDDVGDSKLKLLLTEEFGSWPIINSTWSEGDFSLEDTMVKLNTHGLQAVLGIEVSVDLENSSARVMAIDQTSFGMPGQKYYLVPRNDSMLTAYQDYIEGVARLMGGATATGVNVKSDAHAIVDFERKLAEISVRDEDRRDFRALYNEQTLGEIHGNYSAVFDWKTYVRRVMTSPNIGVTDVTDGEKVINFSPSYYSNLTTLLNHTDKRTLSNYLLWRFVMMVMGTLGEAYMEIYRAYRATVHGIKTDKPRFRQCGAYSTAYGGQVVGRMFIKDNFKPEAKTMALEMIENLQASFNNILDELEWMDEHTKQAARTKNGQISYKIGYPEEIRNDTFLDEMYVNYTYHADDYFGNVIQNQKESFAYSMRQLRLPFDKEQWTTPPSTVNAYYSSTRNQIMFPAGILQPPFYSGDYPKSLNYGGIGVVIGHEITHGFDDRGRQFDGSGNLVQWWSDTAIAKFTTKAQCIVQQYGNFTVPELSLKMNGVNTQGENIADNGGLKQSFRAYRKWVAARGREEALLPGLSYTHDQLFFINFSQLWCTLTKKQTALSRLLTGVHSPGRFRVIGTVQNSEDFAKAFNCPRSSHMNPPTKCNVW